MMLEKDGEDKLDGLLNNDTVLHRVKEERNILHTRRRKAKLDWAHIA
jgi:hypothetical protein